MSAEDEPLPADIAELLRRERDAAGPSVDARARIQKRVLASLGGGLATAALAKSAATGKAVAMGGVASKLTVVVVACALGAGALGVGAYAVVHRGATPPEHRIVASRAVATTPVIAVPPPEVPAVAAPAPAPKSSAPHLAHHTDPRSDLREERALLATAHDALASSDAVGAIAALDRHAHRFPAGQLAEERECLRIRALVEAGDNDAADRAARAFAQRYPNSLFHAATCASRDGTR